jgi:hypothetical protein
MADEDTRTPHDQWRDESIANAEKNAEPASDSAGPDVSATAVTTGTSAPSVVTN